MEEFIFAVLIYCLSVLVLTWGEVRYLTERYTLFVDQISAQNDARSDFLGTVNKALAREKHKVGVLEAELQEIKDALPLTEKKELGLRRIRIEEEV